MLEHVPRFAVILWRRCQTLGPCFVFVVSHQSSFSPPPFLAPRLRALCPSLVLVAMLSNSLPSSCPPALCPLSPGALRFQIPATLANPVPCPPAVLHPSRACKPCYFSCHASDPVSLCCLPGVFFALANPLVVQTVCSSADDNTMEEGDNILDKIWDLGLAFWALSKVSCWLQQWQAHRNT